MHPTEEVFKQLKDFPAYRVSSFGRIQSRWQKRATYAGFLKSDVWKDIKAGENQKGYKQLVLCDGFGKKKTVRVHNLVAEEFIGKKPAGMVVRHIDNNPRNNRLENLAYGTYLENERDKIENGTWNTRNGGAKLTPEKVSEIRRKLSLGASQSDLARDYGVSRPTITRIANNTIWRTSS